MHGTWQIVRRLSKPRHTGEVFVVQNAQGQVGALKRYVPKCRGERALFDRERKFNEDQPVPDVMPRWLGSGSDKDGNSFFVTELVTTLEERWRKEVEVDSGRNSPSVNLKDLVRTMKRLAAACAKLRDGATTITT